MLIHKQLELPDEETERILGTNVAYFIIWSVLFIILCYKQGTDFLRITVAKRELYTYIYIHD